MCSGAAPTRLTQQRRVPPVARRGDLQDLADRLDPEGTAMLVDEIPQDFSRLPSSAWAKNALTKGKGIWNSHCLTRIARGLRFAEGRTLYPFLEVGKRRRPNQFAVSYRRRREHQVVTRGIAPPAGRVAIAEHADGRFVVAIVAVAERGA